MTDETAAKCDWAQGELLAHWASDGATLVSVSDDAPSLRGETELDAVTADALGFEESPAPPLAESHRAEESARLASALEHVSECPSCREHAMQIAALDRSLTTGFASIDAALDDRLEIGVARSLAELRREPFLARRLRRSRRWVRLVLWLAVVGLTFAGCCALWIALRRALESFGG